MCEFLFQFDLHPEKYIVLSKSATWSAILCCSYRWLQLFVSGLASTVSWRI